MNDCQLFRIHMHDHRGSSNFQLEPVARESYWLFSTITFLFTLLRSSLCTQGHAEKKKICLTHAEKSKTVRRHFTGLHDGEKKKKKRKRERRICRVKSLKISRLRCFAYPLRQSRPAEESGSIRRLRPAGSGQPRPTSPAPFDSPPPRRLRPCC